LGRILETSALTEAQLENTRTLAENCNLYESLDYLHPTTDMASHGNHFHFYDNERLTGFLTFPFNGVPEPEAFVIVDPQHRRKGIGRALVDAAKESCKRRGIQQFLLVSEDKSVSGKAFAEATGKYRHSEYRMRLEGKPSKPTESAISLRQAGETDVNSLAHLLAESFQDPIETHSERLKRDIGSPTHRFYIASLAGEQMGCIGVVAENRRAYVIAFGLPAEYRDHGYGRQILTQTVNDLVSENWEDILIEVEANNRAALSLYKSCGFTETTSYNYYAVKTDS
jgi:ribosomal protein S18 acetylase RimI-like enzyme